MTKTRMTIVALSFSAAVVISAAVSVGAAPRRSVSDMLTPDVQESLMIALDSDDEASSAQVSKKDAVAIAADWLGRSDDPGLVEHGVGRRTSSDLPEPVWVVVYPGGDPPPYEAPDTSTVVDFTGVLLDDKTGEPLRSFGWGHNN